MRRRRGAVFAAAGAVLGDHLWYLIGRFGGGRIIALYCRITRQADDCEARAGGCFARYGGTAIVIARFFTAIRILMSPIAARSGMPYLNYFAYDALGAFLWASVFVALGYWLGERGATMLPGFGLSIALWTLIGLAAGWVLARRGYHRWKRHRGTPRAHPDRRAWTTDGPPRAIERPPAPPVLVRADPRLESRCRAGRRTRSTPAAHANLDGPASPCRGRDRLA